MGKAMVTLRKVGDLLIPKIEHYTWTNAILSSFSASQLNGLVGKSRESMIQLFCDF